MHFFYHFPTKKVLFLELLDGWLESLNQSMEEIVKSSPGMSDTLLKIIGIIKIVTDSSGGKLPLFLQFWSASVLKQLNIFNPS